MTLLEPILAYIDPGTGQAVLYALGAFVTGIAFQFRRIKLWITSKFRRAE